MSIAIVHTRTTIGINARPVSVEVHLSNGLPSFAIVGLPETAVKESKDRVRSAIINSQFEFPPQRITVNLAPADLPKTGSGFDLPIALGILAASGQIPSSLFETHEFIAELALDGHLRGIPAIIPIVIAAHQHKKHLIIAKANEEEATLARHDDVMTAEHLRDVCLYLRKGTSLSSLPPRPETLSSSNTGAIDWSDIKGQHHAKYALEIAACGGHSLLLAGPPGSGKTMLAKRFITILPELPEKEALECASLRSISRKHIEFNHWRTPPFRAPHHTASTVALVGGGNPPKPGEISLAHHGVLFLDELPEFSRHALETLREPLESGEICISRAATQMEYPAKFQLIAAMNPCPCGQIGNPNAKCLCTPERVQRYLSKLSGPLLDRIDMHLVVQALTETELLTPHKTALGESTRIQTRVKTIRELQIKRQGMLNAYLGPKACEEACELGKTEQKFLTEVLQRLKLSGRGFHRLLKVARTIADLQETSRVNNGHLKQALSYKQTLRPVGFQFEV